MNSILSPEARPVLDRLASERALLAFDFDGTLAPIVRDRDAAQVRPETRGLLRAVSLLYPCAVISGRGRADVAARLRDVPLVAVVGNHGAEAGHGPLDRTRRQRIVRWIERLRALVAAEPGIELEDKRFSVAVHYRAAAVPTRARRVILETAAALDGARVFGGRAVVNIVPDDAPDKGVAIGELARRLSAKTVLYVGDDRTDESAFGSPSVAVSVRVGRTGRSTACYYVPSQREVDELLRALLEARTRRDGVSACWERLVRAAGDGT